MPHVPLTMYMHIPGQNAFGNHDHRQGMETKVDPEQERLTTSDTAASQ